MVTQLVVEDEYTINVKLRRPLTNGSCIKPPTITITPEDPSMMVQPPPKISLTHTPPVKSVNGAPPMVVGCASISPKSYQFEGPPWRPCDMENDEDYEDLEDQVTPYRLSIMAPDPSPFPPPPPPKTFSTTSPPPPPIRRRQEDRVPEDKVTLGCLRLPLVQVFSDDNSLVATNKFSAPEKSLSSSFSVPTSSHTSGSQLLPQEPKPAAPGSLYVERIPAHCKSDCGVLYVPPVNEQSLRRSRNDEPPAKGNSRRRNLKSMTPPNQQKYQMEVPSATPLPPEIQVKPISQPEKVPPRGSSSKAAARAILSEVLSPRIENQLELQPTSPKAFPPPNFNFCGNNITNNSNVKRSNPIDINRIGNNKNYNIRNTNNYTGYINNNGINNNSNLVSLARNHNLTNDGNSDEKAGNENKRSTAVLNFSVSQENKKNKKSTDIGRKVTSLSGLNKVSSKNNKVRFEDDNDSYFIDSHINDEDYSFSDEGERVVEVYGGVAAHAHSTAHAHTSQPVSGSGLSGHADQARPQPVDPALLTSLDLESDHHSHNMLVTEVQHPAHSRHHPHDLNHNNQVFGQKPSEELNQISGRASMYVVDDRSSNIGLDNFGFDNEVVGQDNYGYDPGYSSERSPEDEEGPPLYYRKAQKERENRALEKASSSKRDRRSLMVGPGEVVSTKDLMKLFPFISEGTVFEVTVIKNLRGLGLALTGGIECDIPYAGLVRIKKLYPQTPAWLCGQLQIGDIVLSANTHQLTGLSSHEALELLRTCGQEVSLEVCRPPEGALGEEEDVLDGGSGQVIVTTSLTAPNASQNYLSPSPSFSTCGEFEIELTKVAGSLGFTLRKQDNSILGHTIRTLVKEPAISDGRLRPGDKIISVNNTDMCSLSHEEAIAFLRTCPETVTLKLYRDAMQTPVSPISPTEPEMIVKPKALRKEARDMLSDLAFRKQSPSNSPSLAGSTNSPGTPRRRRLQKTPSPDIKTVVADRWDSLVRRTEESLPGSPTLDCKLSSLNSIRETDHEVSPFGDSQTDDSTSTTLRSRNSSSVSSCSLTPSISDASKPKRPSFLDLSSGRSCSRKTQFTPPHEIDQSFPSPIGNQYPSVDSVDSAPQLTSTHSDTPAFSHLQQGYHSVNLGAIHAHEDSRLTNTTSDHNISGHDNDGPTNNGLLKWKGIVFTPEEEDSEESLRDDGSSSSLSSQKSHKPKAVTLELNRGWNSRLGFSLQPQDDKTIITAIYADSVAAKDGRLRVGDIVIKVNGVDVVGWDCESVIDLLRKTRGNISLSVIQCPS